MDPKTADLTMKYEGSASPDAALQRLEDLHHDQDMDTPQKLKFEGSQEEPCSEQKTAPPGSNPVSTEKRGSYGQSQFFEGGRRTFIKEDESIKRHLDFIDQQPRFQR